MKLKSIAFVLIGIVLGCGAAAVSPTVRSYAQGKSGWACYDVADFPDVEQAAFNAGQFRDGMNQVAANASPGTMITLTPRASANGGSASVVCVKR